MEYKKSKLILVPTPISEELPLDGRVLNVLREEVNNPHALFVFEDRKMTFKRWVKWGLPREKMEHFLFLNEHNESADFAHLGAKLKGLPKGEGRLFLFSDGGLPAFMDPGQKLIDYCHRAGLRVSSMPFDHSVAQALALSGYAFKSYIFRGFLSRDKKLRTQEMKEVAKTQEMQVLMDTPYRLRQTLEEISKAYSSQGKGHQREVFLGVDLNGEKELVLRMNPEKILALYPELKGPFVLVTKPMSQNLKLKSPKKRRPYHGRS